MFLLLVMSSFVDKDVAVIDNGIQMIDLCVIIVFLIVGHVVYLL
jgi:hypothetical protein